MGGFTNEWVMCGGGGWAGNSEGSSAACVFNKVRQSRFIASHQLLPQCGRSFHIRYSFM